MLERKEMEGKKMAFIIEIKINGEWKLWQRYDQCSRGYTPKERAEKGMKVASCYGECRMVEVESK